MDKQDPYIQLKEKHLKNHKNWIFTCPMFKGLPITLLAKQKSLKNVVEVLVKVSTLKLNIEIYFYRENDSFFLINKCVEKYQNRPKRTRSQNNSTSSKMTITGSYTLPNALKK